VNPVQVPSGSDRFGVYVHVPFCERKCPYCDFYSVEGTDLKERYLNALHREIAKASRRPHATAVDTIYIGGGTPSLLTAEEIERILSEIGRCFTVAQDAERTIEVNPGTTTRESLRMLRQLGMNRLSIGVQSFDDRALSFLGRIHTVAEARSCFETARAVGFENISIDLIFAIPGQSQHGWEDTLKEALALSPDHISAYSLIVEDHTPLFELVKSGSVVPVGEDEEAAQFTLTMALLEDSGYDHYEVSNYARPGRRSRHNSAYWHHRNYLGFGPSAHSFWVDARVGEAWRWANVRQVGGYCDLLWREGSPVAMAEELGTRELVNERIFLGLRSDGLSLPALTNDLGYELSAEQRAYLHQLLARSLAVLSGGTVRLTREGFLFCDEICSHLMTS
jgi:oxygen-independent coproporphyrinogen III oxidase